MQAREINWSRFCWKQSASFHKEESQTNSSPVFALCDSPNEGRNLEKRRQTIKRTLHLSSPSKPASEWVKTPLETPTCNHRDFKCWKNGWRKKFLMRIRIRRLIWLFIEMIESVVSCCGTFSPSFYFREKLKTWRLVKDWILMTSSLAAMSVDRWRRAPCTCNR